MVDAPKPESSLADLAQQINPEGYDPTLTLRENAWKYTGYDDPSVEQGPSTPVITNDQGQELLDPDLPFTKDDEPFLQRMSANSDAWLAQEGDFMPAFAKAFASTENFGDNIGTLLQVNAAYYAARSDFPDMIQDKLANVFGSDVQFGVTMNSRKGSPAFGGYRDVLYPEDLYGPDWKTMSKEEMYAARRKKQAEQIEKYYGPVQANSLAEGSAWFSSMILDTANFAPTGYVGLAAKLGKMGVKSGMRGGLAGAIVSQPWYFGSVALDQHISGEEMSPSKIMAGAVFSGLAGFAMPYAATFFHGLYTKHSRHGNAITTDMVKAEQQATIERFTKLREEVTGRALPETPETQELHTNLLKEIDAILAATSKQNPADVATTWNTKLVRGEETQAQIVISDALKMRLGDDNKSLDALQFFDRMDQADIEAIKNSASYKKLDPESKKAVDNHVAVRQGREPEHPQEGEVKIDAEEMAAAQIERAAKDTDELMRTLGSHTRAYKTDVMRQMTNSAMGMGIAGGGTYALTGDEDFAMMAAIGAGGLSIAGPLARKSAWGFVTRGYEKLNSPDMNVRMEGIQEIQGSFTRAFANGIHRFNNTDWGSVPIREWANRGGASKLFSTLATRTTEDIRTRVSHDVIRFKNIMQDFDIKKGEDVTVARLLAKTIKPDDPLVKKKHRDAAVEVRKLYDEQLDRLVEVKVLKASEARALKKQAVEEGYLNRIYDTDFLRTEKGAKAFADALAKVGRNADGTGGIPEKDALGLIHALTGEKAADARKRLQVATTKDGEGFRTFTREGIHDMLKSAYQGSPQVDRFVEQARTIPTHLESVLEPFLIRDLDHVFTKYVEAAARRTELARTFGAEGERMHGISKQIAKEWGDARLGEKAYQDYLGMQFHPENKWLKEYFEQSNGMRTGNQIIQYYQNSKLIASAPINFTQHLVYLPTLMSQMGMSTPKTLKTMYKAYGSAMSELKAEAKRRGTAGTNYLNTAGVLTDQITYSATGDFAMAQGHPRLGKFSGLVKDPSFWLKAGGFEGVERFNRRVASHAGRMIVEDTFNRRRELMAMGTLNRRRQLELDDLNARMIELGFDPKIKEGDISVAELDRAGEYVSTALRDFREEGAIDAAAQRVSNMSNFQSDYMNKPRWWNTPLGQWFGKFRSFMIHGTSFISDNVIKPLQHGNTVPLATFLVAGGAMFPIAQFKELLKNDDIERTNTEKFLHANFAVGTLGLFGDGAKQLSEYPQSIGSYFVGPVLSDIVNVPGKLAVAGAEYSKEGDIQALAEELTKILAPPATYVAGPITRITGNDNPLATQQERTARERAAELGISLPKGYTGYD